MSGALFKSLSATLASLAEKLRVHFSSSNRQRKGRQAKKPLSLKGSESLL